MSASWDEASGNIMLEMTSEQPSPQIRYTTDGSDPVQGSPLYDKPLKMTEKTIVKAAIFSDGKIREASAQKTSISTGDRDDVHYNIPFSDRYKGHGK